MCVIRAGGLHIVSMVLNVMGDGKESSVLRYRKV